MSNHRCRLGPLTFLFRSPWDHYRLPCLFVPRLPTTCCCESSRRRYLACLCHVFRQLAAVNAPTTLQGSFVPRHPATCSCECSRAMSSDNLLLQIKCFRRHRKLAQRSCFAHPLTPTSICGVYCVLFFKTGEFQQSTLTGFACQGIRAFEGRLGASWCPSSD